MRPAAATGVVAERRAPESARIDLVKLAMSYADAIGECEIAHLEFESLKKLADSRAVSSHELAIAGIKFKTAERKMAVLRRIAESAIVAAEMEREAAKARFARARKKPLNPAAVETAESEVIRAESRLRILKSILD